jgi:hypothetical protein
MTVSEVNALKIVASRNFSISNPQFIEIHDAGLSAQKEMAPEHYDVFAHLKLDYTGTVPLSYRVINSIVLDYVEENRVELEKLIAPELFKHFSQEDSDISVEGSPEDLKDFIWEEQVDYMPMVNEEGIFIEIELVTDLEPL